MEKIKGKKLIKEIAKKYSLELLLLFGSRISGELQKESDFDIAYLSKKELDLMGEAKLICDLMPLFQSEKIDLVNLKKASPLLLFAITQNCQILHQRNPIIFPALRVYAFKKYIETKPLYEEKFRRLKKMLKKIKVK